MTNPLISVSIMTFNSAKFIRECLESVLKQDYPSMEVIISDDASTDDTVAILAEYQKKYSDIIKTIINPSNIGITKNSNILLSHCRGKYVAFFAGDDVMLPGKISKQVAYMEAHPECSICYHDAEVFFSHNATSEKPYLHQHAARPKQGNLKVAIKYGPFNATPTCMVRRDKIPSHGFDERLKIASDALFWVEILETGGEIHYIDEVLVRYRVHGQNISKSSGSEIALDFLILYSKLLTKHPEYASEILSNYAASLFALAKYNPNPIHYLKASFKIKKRIKVLMLILAYYLSFGKLSFNSQLMQNINKIVTRSRIQFNKLRKHLAS